jgi:hypothetical protein
MWHETICYNISANSHASSGADRTLHRIVNSTIRDAWHDRVRRIVFIMAGDLYSHTKELHCGTAKTDAHSTRQSASLQHSQSDVITHKAHETHSCEAPRSRASQPSSRRFISKIGRGHRGESVCSKQMIIYEQNKNENIRAEFGYFPLTR